MTADSAGSGALVVTAATRGLIAMITLKLLRRYRELRATRELEDTTTPTGEAPA